MSDYAIPVFRPICVSVGLRRVLKVTKLPLFAEGVGRRDKFASADGRLRLVRLDVGRLKLHLLLLAEGNLTLVVSDLLVGGVLLVLLGEIISIILIKLVKEGPHDVLGGCLVYHSALLLTVGWQGHLARLGLSRDRGKHEPVNRLFPFLLASKEIKVS